jgi:hypothetical protein
VSGRLEEASPNAGYVFICQSNEFGSIVNDATTPSMR